MTKTNLEIATAEVEAAQSHVDTQTHVLNQLADTVTAERERFSAAEKRVNEGKGSPDDVDAVVLGEGRLSAHEGARAKAEARLAELETLLHIARVKAHTEKTREQYPDGFVQTAKNIRSEAAEQIAEIITVVTEKLQRVEQDERAAHREVEALARPLIWETGTGYDKKWEHTPASKAAHVVVGDGGNQLQRAGSPLTISTPDGFTINDRAAASFWGVGETAGTVLGREADAIVKRTAEAEAVAA